MGLQAAVPLSAVMKSLQQGVEGIKRATLMRVQHPKRNVAEYAGETVTVLGEIEAAMEVAARRIAELEGVGYYAKPQGATTPAPRPRAPSLSDEISSDDETEKPGLEEPFERPVDPDTEVNGALSGDAITAILQHVDACASHDEAMEELKTAQEALAGARQGGKREAAQRVATAQARLIETWTAKQETYDLQKLLADRARPA